MFRIGLFIMVFALFSSCKEVGSQSTYQKINVELKKNEIYEYEFLRGDEEGIQILTQAKHYHISKITEEDSTYRMVYTYQADSDYVGTDEVELEFSSIVYGRNVVIIYENLKINFDVRE